MIFSTFKLQILIKNICKITFNVFLIILVRKLLYEALYSIFKFFKNGNFLST